MYKNKWVAYVLVIPMLLFFGLFLIYPFIKNIIDSMYSYTSVLDKNPIFVGLANYKEMFNDLIFLKSLANTMILVILVIVFQVGIALVLAFLVSAINKLATFFKITFFLPIVISATALGLMFNLFYDYDYGMFNQILAVFNLDKVFWMNPDNLVVRYLFIVMPVIWQYIGFYFVIFLTGLACISDEICEAADIDGCTGLQKVFKVKIPMLRNVISTVLVLAITGTLKVFDLPYIISPGGYPNGETHFLGTYMYDKAFNSSQIGVAAAFAVFIVVLGLVMSVVSNLLFKKSEDL